MTIQRLQVHEVVGTVNAILGSQGNRLYVRILPLLVKGIAVELDFSGIRVLNSGFCNASVGRVYRELGSEEIEDLLSFSGLDSERKRRALRDAIDLGKDPQLLDNMRQAFEQYLEQQDEQDSTPTS